ncbi:MAG: RNA polymerase sigma factor RpoH [Gammaproteobacteria bacterium]|jgi:RNA polymerase sigma-32 factor
MTEQSLILKGSSMPTPVGNLETYIQAVNRLPVLSADEEQKLARRYGEQDDLDAARLLIMHNLRFVVQVARGYLGYGLPLGDLVQEGNIGLMKAVKRFDPGMNVRLVSFAVHWIRAEIHEFILRNWRIVKVATTKAQRKLFFNLRSSRKRLGWLNMKEAESIAEQLGVSTKDVMEMESRMNGQDLGYDLSADDDEESSYYAPAAYLSQEGEDPAEQLEAEDWESYNHQRMGQALSSLDERARDIVARRWLSSEKATLHELAAEYDVSAERIRQIESGAIKKLRNAMAD